MKKMLKFIPAVVLGALFSVNSFAQTKIGHINMGEVILLLPETKKADDELQKFGSTLEGQLKTMGNEYQTKLEEYQTKRELMTDAIRQDKEKEILGLQTRINEFQQSAQESIQKKKEELYEPILKKVNDAVQAVSKEASYGYVIDSSVGVLLVTQESSDLGPLVKKKLGISPDAKLPDNKAQMRPAGGK